MLTRGQCKICWLFLIWYSQSYPVELSVLKSPSVSTELYGYTKLDAFWDDQQMIGFRDDQFFISPEPTRTIGMENNEANSRGQFHFTAIESQLGVIVTDTEWHNKTQAQGRLEMDFFGVTEASVASTRLRHAYAHVYEEDNFDILCGQTWHPLFIDTCHPRTLGFDYGAPAEFQARSPQIRFTKYHNNIAYTCTMLSQQDPFTNTGPDGPSAQYIRQSMMPEFNWRIDIPIHDHLVGTSIGVKRLVPRIETDEEIPTNQSVTGVTAEMYGTWNTPYFSLSAKAIYAQNATEHVMLGGYGITSRDPVTDKQSYETIDAGGGWIDVEVPIHTNWHIGTLIAGIKKRNDETFLGDTGTESAISHRFSLIPRADSVLRISPRVYWKYNSFKCGLEIAIARTQFAQANAENGRLQPLFAETGVRTLLVSYYYF